MTAGYFLKVEQREENPVAQTARTHRGGGEIEHVIERHSVGREGFYKLKVADSEAVEGDITVRVYASESGDMA